MFTQAANDLGNAGNNIVNDAVSHPLTTAAVVGLLAAYIPMKIEEKNLKKVHAINTAKEIIYKGLTNDQARLLSSALDIHNNDQNTLKLKLSTPLSDTFAQLESDNQWGRGLYSNHLKNAARAFIGYLERRQDRHLGEGSLKDVQAYISKHCMESMLQLSMARLDDNLVSTMRKLKSAWFRLVGNRLFAPSKLPHSIHLRKAILEAIKYLSLAIKDADYELKHQASSNYYHNIKTATNTLQSENIPNFILNALTQEYSAPVINFQNFTDNSWSHHNDTLLQAILYFYMTKVTKLPDGNNIVFDKLKSPRVDLLIKAIEKKLAPENLDTNSPEYLLKFIAEIGKIKIQWAPTMSYGMGIITFGAWQYEYAYYYPNENNKKDYVWINTGFATYYHNEKLLPEIANLLKQTIPLGHMNTTLEDLYTISKNLGSHGISTSNLSSDDVLKKSLQIISGLSDLLKTFHQTQSNKFDTYYGLSNVADSKKQHLNNAFGIVDTQVPRKITTVRENSRHVKALIKEFLARNVSQKDAVRKFVKTVNDFMRLANSCATQNNNANNNPQNAQAQAQPAPAPAPAQAQPQPRTINNTQYPWVNLMTRLFSHSNDDIHVLSMFLIYQTIIDKNIDAATTQQNIKELDLMNAPNDTALAQSLSTVYSHRQKLLTSKLGLYKLVDNSNRNAIKTHTQHISSLANFNLKMFNDYHRSNSIPSNLPVNNESLTQYKATVTEAYNFVKNK